GAAAAAGGGSSGGAGAGSGAAVSEGLGAPVKAGVAAGVVAVAAAAVALALIGDDSPSRKPDSKPPASAPAVEPARNTPTPPNAAPEPAPPVVARALPPARTATPTSTPTPSPPRPTPSPTRTTAPPRTPAPTPTITPAPTPTPTSPPAPAVYRWSELSYDITGDGTEPEMRIGQSSWVWQRYGVSVADQRYAHGVTVHGHSSVTVDLNRECSAYDALVGVDDLTAGLGRVSFSVYADGVRLWRSGTVEGGDAAVPVHVGLAGRETVRLVVEPHSHFDNLALADWAESRFTCS
ncbi:NPCBM/NEW2 domain-containing protein, partial [Streptomyces resistomycificus]